MQNFDFVIIGAGIVGLATAREIKQRRPDATIAILDKEEKLGVHASGRNSGVLHCGIFYGKDTIKAKVCADGARRMMAFADEHGVYYRRCGKVIVGTRENQLAPAEKLMQNARDNGIRAEMIDVQTLREIEPYAAEGVARIYSPDTGVIDSPSLLAKLRDILAAQGVAFYFGQEAQDFTQTGVVKTQNESIGYGYLINCAGAYADRVAKAFGLAGDYALVPFKGLYWKLSPDANPRVRANIYPIPDPAFPFLGVHLTRVASGDVYIGPTSIPAFGRENYGIVAGAQPAEAAQIGWQIIKMYIANQNNFRRLAHVELGKYWKANFLRTAQRLCPSVQDADMVPTGKVGIRPQLVNVKTSRLEMDYIFERTDNTLHVLNTISPAWTSAFAFADIVVDKANIR